ncbi:DUF2513 domain-containing protein [Paenibacillus illinoisensis]|uniref:DUF2513 domain-containing protein n=1 Tax=Paenibacillus illinoisensis TaxID=59845 RepID=UPI003D2D5F80
MKVGIYLRRDVELMIKALEFIEEHNTATNTIVVNIEGYDTEEEREFVQYQVKLLKDAGFIVAKEMNQPYELYVRSMTVQGHEFLDSARDKNIVKAAKDIAKSKGSELFSLPIEIIKGLLGEAAKKYFLGS